MLRWRGHSGRTRGIRATCSKSVLWRPKKKKREKLEKVLPLHSTRANKNSLWLVFLAYNGDLLGLVQKRFLGCSAKRRNNLLVCWFEEESAACSFHIEDALCSTSHCACRLNITLFNTSLAIPLSHVFSPYTFTDPMFKVSFSCMMLYHPRRVPVPLCTEARRPSPRCRTTWNGGTCSCCRCK
jgi:hypothetical protein